MANNYEIDSIDKKIIKLMEKDARMPFLEMARKIGVSGGTIHQRVEKLREAGVIVGSTIKVDYTKFGHNVVVLLGLHLVNARDIHKVIEKLEKMDEIVEAYYTTGDYALIVKIIVKDINHFHEFLIGKIQMIKEIQSTESFISLKQVINKSLNV
ncbi:Lrp/AsnC ligand binding domain-containing protein [Halobacteriovorax sp. RT-2-6]|uniref:Lrp/AsnC ligand binding domain-containing protein n=1 Tax=unclassified Halobacteriovorax TaxID=2639665 RepID=UPI00399B7720